MANTFDTLLVTGCVALLALTNRALSMPSFLCLTVIVPMPPNSK